MTMGVYTCGECGAKFFSGHKHVCEPKAVPETVNLVWVDPEQMEALRKEDSEPVDTAVQLAFETFKS